jgi:DNA polymerase III subunit chi
MPLSDPGRVDFYVLASADTASRLRFACRLAEKVYRLSQRVHMHTDSAALAAEMDELLWTFRQGSFIPHEVSKAGEVAQSPITIGHGAERPPDANLLINLASDVPGFVVDFPRVAEIVDASDDGKQLGRERFRHYRDSGRPPVTHNIGARQ